MNRKKYIAKQMAAIGVSIAIGFGAAQCAEAKAEPLTSCPGIRAAVAGGETSCAFALNVRQAWFGQPGNPVLAYSPVTGKLYTMMCVYGFDIQFSGGMRVFNSTRCVDAEGGSAIAYVW